MDLSAEKIDVSMISVDESGLVFDEIGEYATEEVSEPLRGVLIGLIFSVPIWISCFIIFKIF
jgi:hypothetical protein